MNTKIKTEIAIGIILLLAIIIGAIFLMQSKKEVGLTQMPSKNISQTTKTSNSGSTIASDYGFNFSVSAGWHIWEGASATEDMMNKTDFGSVLESGSNVLTGQKIKEYQIFLDNWKAGSSNVITFTESAVDYKDRNFGNMGKVMSTLIDSEDMIKQQKVDMYVSESSVDFGSKGSSIIKERQTIKINQNDAVFSVINNNWKLVDMVTIDVPIDSTRTINGKKVSSLKFMEYVKKDSQTDYNNLISFVLSLKISSNQ